jgi:hypothetical protein
VKFKERSTNAIYEARLVGEGEVIVRLLPPHQQHMEKITIKEFVERFDETYV